MEVRGMTMRLLHALVVLLLVLPSGVLALQRSHARGVPKTHRTVNRLVPYKQRERHAHNLRVGRVSEAAADEWEQDLELDEDWGMSANPHTRMALVQTRRHDLNPMVKMETFEGCFDISLGVKVANAPVGMTVSLGAGLLVEQAASEEKEGHTEVVFNLNGGLLIGLQVPGVQMVIKFEGFFETTFEVPDEDWPEHSHQQIAKLAEWTARMLLHRYKWEERTIRKLGKLRQEWRELMTEGDYTTEAMKEFQAHQLAGWCQAFPERIEVLGEEELKEKKKRAVLCRFGKCEKHSLIQSAYVKMARPIFNHPFEAVTNREYLGELIGLDEKQGSRDEGAPSVVQIRGKGSASKSVMASIELDHSALRGFIEEMPEKPSESAPATYVQKHEVGEDDELVNNDLLVGRTVAIEYRVVCTEPNHDGTYEATPMGVEVAALYRSLNTESTRMMHWLYTATRELAVEVSRQQQTISEGGTIDKKHALPTTVEGWEVVWGKQIVEAFKHIFLGQHDHKCEKAVAPDCEKDGLSEGACDQRYISYSNDVAQYAVCKLAKKRIFTGQGDGNAVVRLFKKTFMKSEVMDVNILDFAHVVFPEIFERDMEEMETLEAGDWLAMMKARMKPFGESVYHFDDYLQRGEDMEYHEIWAGMLGDQTQLQELIRDAAKETVVPTALEVRRGGKLKFTLKLLGADSLTYCSGEETVSFTWGKEQTGTYDGTKEIEWKTGAKVMTVAFEIPTPILKLKGNWMQTSPRKIDKIKKRHKKKDRKALVALGDDTLEEGHESEFDIEIGIPVSKETKDVIDEGLKAVEALKKAGVNVFKPMADLLCFNPTRGVKKTKEEKKERVARAIKTLKQVLTAAADVIYNFGKQKLDDALGDLNEEIDTLLNKMLPADLHGTVDQLTDQLMEQAGEEIGKQLDAAKKKLLKPREEKDEDAPEPEPTEQEEPEVGEEDEETKAKKEAIRQKVKEEVAKASKGVTALKTKIADALKKVSIQDLAHDAIAKGIEKALEIIKADGEREDTLVLGFSYKLKSGGECAFRIGVETEHSLELPEVQLGATPLTFKSSASMATGNMLVFPRKPPEEDSEELQMDWSGSELDERIRDNEDEKEDEEQED